MKEPSAADWAKGRGKSKGNAKPNKATTEKGNAAEDAPPPETENQDNQWLEPAGTSRHETWQADSSSWDWSAEAGWEYSAA